MGLLDYLGLNDLADAAREFTDSFDGLKQDIIDAVVTPGEELQGTVSDIASSITQDTPTPIDETVNTTE